MTRLALIVRRPLHLVLVPVLAVAAASAVNNAVPRLSTHTPLLMLLAAVTITALLAGFLPAIAAALAGAVIAQANWLPVAGPDAAAARAVPIVLSVLLLTAAIGRLIGQRASACRRMQASEQHYRTLVQLCPDPVLALRDGVWIMANPAAVRLLETASEADLVGKPVLDFIAPSYRAWVTEQRMPNALAGRRNPIAEQEWLTVNGDPVAVEATAVGVEGEGMVLLFAHDLRERRTREAETRRVSDVLATVIDSSPTAIVTVDGEKRVTLWNHAAEEMFGWSRDEVLGQVYPLILPNDEDRQEALANFDRVFSDGLRVTRELKRLRRDGNSIDVLMSGAVLTGEDGRPAGAVISALDITERKRSDRVLAESEERYRSLYAAMAEGVMLLYPLFDAAGEFVDYQILDVNPAFERITGIQAVRAITALGSELLGDQLPPMLERLRPIVKQQQPVRFEVAYQDKPLSASAFPVGANRLAVVFEDLTERKQLEQQLTQAQKMEAVGQLAGGVAHDFNNLLTTILGYAEVAAERFPAGDPGREDIGQIQKAGEAAAALTRQLLAFSRRQILQPVVFNLNAKLSDIHALVRRLIGEHIDLVFIPSEADLCVALDPGQLEQIVLNLAANSRDAMPDGGRITIRTSRTSVATGIHPGGVAIAPGRYAVLTVSDTGTGMAPEVQARLFDPFFTTKEIGKGTGLGLSTVYGIVKQSGGYITVDSEPGKGSTFHLYFPTADRCSEMAAAERTVRAHRRASRVLIVEDNAPLRELAVRALTRHGHHALAAEDAAEALSLLESTADVDLLLTDIGLPGENGIGLAETVVRRYPDVRVLYMTGHPRDAATCGRLEADVPLLQKPFTLSALVEQVNDALAR